MPWRFGAAGLLLAVGFGIWEADQLAGTDQVAPRPGHRSFPTQSDATIGATVRKMIAENAFPTGGAISYHDALLPPDPPERAREGMHSALRGMLQYTVAPVILDESGSHELTLVLTRQRTIHLQRRQAAGAP
jgi:hypothetical protein